MQNLSSTLERNFEGKKKSNPNLIKLLDLPTKLEELEGLEACDKCQQDFVVSKIQTGDSTGQMTWFLQQISRR